MLLSFSQPYVMMQKYFSRGHTELNHGPLDLQSNALPLSYTPSGICCDTKEHVLTKLANFTCKGVTYGLGEYC